MREEPLWYLGIDVGTTDLRAVLLQTGSAARAMPPQEYPLYWQGRNSPENEEPQWSFPAAAYLGLTAKPEEQEGSARRPGMAVLPILIGSEALARKTEKDGVLLNPLKPYLNLGIPYYARGLHRWEPKLQISNTLEVSLDWVQFAVGALLATLNPSNLGGVARVGAVGLSEDDLRAALTRLEGVILSCPASGSDAYRFNLREAVLGAGLVREAGQVVFVEEAIAALLGTARWQDAPYSGHYALSPPGATLILHCGATISELALVNLPEKTEKLSYFDFALRSFPYGGQAIAEDLFYQLLYPQWLPEQPFLAKLKLDIPQPGQPDFPKRDRARSELLSFPGGRRWLETAQRAWLILQHQAEFSAQLGEQQWGVQCQEFQHRVIAPFIQELNRELNALLGQTGLSADAIASVLCSGGTGLALSREIQAWLGQKLPNATFVQGETPRGTSLVALGLARLPFFPQACDRLRHQYSDYFLLRELLQVLPNHSFTLEELMQRLEQRGINTRACTQRLLTLIEGYLPPGLVPTTENAHWLTLASQQNRDYLGITVAPLFARVEGDRYRANGKQCQRLRQYFTALLSGTKQKLEEPASVNL
jgi:hypothetical protein